MSNPRNQASEALTHDEVVSIVGDLDAGTIASIIDIGATYADVEQALSLLGAGTEALRQRPLTAAAEAVYDILSVDPSFSETVVRNR